MAIFEQVLIEQINKAQRASKLNPLILGGSGGPGGGVGGPPGGFIGTLPQKRVSYDTTEAETPAVTISGSLVDNLNHIRYRLHLVEMGTVISGFMPTFLGLGDTPNSYAGYAGTGVAVKADESGLEFVVLSSGVIPDFIGLSDTPDTYAGYSGMIPVVNDEEDGLIFIPLSGLISISVSGVTRSFIGLDDTPVTYLGEAGKITIVNGAEDSLEFVDPSTLFSPILSGFTTTFIDLSDTPSTYSGHAGEAAFVNNNEDGLIFSGITTDFLSLLDTPNSYAGSESMFVTVNPFGTGLEFSPTPSGTSSSLNVWEPDVASDSLHLLTDEFNDNDLDVAWNQIVLDGGAVSLAENDLGFNIIEESIDFDSYKLQATIWKSAPAGNFSVTTKLNSFAFGSNIQPGIIIAEGLEADYTSAKIYLFGWNYGDDGTGPEFILMSGVDTITNWYLDTTNNNGTVPVGIYLRARYSDDNSRLFFDISDNGIGWLERYSTSASTFTPTEIGLSFRSRFNGDGSESDGSNLLKEMYFQYFRVTDSANLVQVNRGKRI